MKGKISEKGGYAWHVNVAVPGLVGLSESSKLRLTKLQLKEQKRGEFGWTLYLRATLIMNENRVIVEILIPHVLLKVSNHVIPTLRLYTSLHLFLGCCLRPSDSKLVLCSSR